MTAYIEKLAPRLQCLVLLLQVPATLGILVWVHPNPGKLITLLMLWAFTFPRPSHSELLFFIAISAFFTIMNAAALAQGIFFFNDPDLLRMPMWELAMWGFYTLHTMRLIGGPTPKDRRAVAWVLALLFAAAFATLADAMLLLAVTSALLVLALAFFHQAHDLAFVGYMIVLGAAVEYTGVHSGLWRYPGDPAGGVPLWFITMWGGVGLFVRRLAMPLIARHEPERDAVPTL